MNEHDPNLERVELVATALGPLRDELVFVGGCAAATSGHVGTTSAENGKTYGPSASEPGAATAFCDAPLLRMPASR